MTRNMAWGPTTTRTTTYLKAIGKMVKGMDLENILLLMMDQLLKASTKIIRNTGSENTHRKMEKINTKSGKTTKRLK